MEPLLILLAGFGIALAIGNRLATTTKQIRKHMAAINDLEAAVLTANGKLELLQTAVDKIVATPDPSLQPRIADAALNVNALGNALLDLKARIDQAVP